MIIYVRGFSVHDPDHDVVGTVQCIFTIQHCMLSNICRASDNLMHRMTELMSGTGIFRELRYFTSGGIYRG